MTPGLRWPTGSGPMRSPGAKRMAMPKSRCGAITSSISDVSGRRSSSVSLSDDRLVEPFQDLAAAFALRAQQGHVLAELRIVAERALHLLGDDGDGGKRRAELMRRRRRQAVQRREMLLALQHQFGGGECVGEQPGFLGNAPGVDRREGDRRQNRHPHAGDVDERNGQRLAGIPGQWEMPEDQRARHQHDQAAEQRGHAQRQRGCGNHHRDGQQQRERIGQAAGEVEQAGELQRIEQQQRQRRIGLQAQRRRIAEGQEQVQPGRTGDQRETGTDRQRKPQPIGDGDDGDALADDRQPAQPDQRVQPQPVCLLEIGRGERLDHGRLWRGLGLVAKR